MDNDIRSGGQSLTIGKLDEVSGLKLATQGCKFGLPLVASPGSQHDCIGMAEGQAFQQAAAHKT
jgi:hypothetical protein